MKPSGTIENENRGKNIREHMSMEIQARWQTQRAAWGYERLVPLCEFPQLTLDLSHAQDAISDSI